MAASRRKSCSTCPQDHPLLRPAVSSGRRQLLAGGLGLTALAGVFRPIPVEAQFLLSPSGGASGSASESVSGGASGDVSSGGEATSTKLATPFGTPLPHDRDACPVCGMFPARYPDWIATILYKDGFAVHFDGAKDLFKYLLDMGKYAPGRSREEILHIGVTDYYATARINARTAFYVIGSDTLGPMGHELVPHPDRYDADAFMKDHQGRYLVRFEDVTMDLLIGLDRGEFVAP